MVVTGLARTGEEGGWEWRKVDKGRRGGRGKRGRQGKKGIG